MKADEPKYRDEEWLREQYVDQRRTSTDIADELGCNSRTVRRWLKRHGIETRQSGRQPPDERLEDADWLQEQYVEQGRTSADIADELGYSASTVQRYLKKQGIETRKGGPQCPDERLEDADWLREQYVEQRRATADIADECGCSPPTVRRWLKRHAIEARPGGDKPIKKLTDEEWLREQYVGKERTTYEIADKCGCSGHAVSAWLNRHGIGTRDGGHELTGPENPNWRGGEAPYGPGWNASKRRQVRERDGYECSDCGTTQAEHKAEYDHKLHVHHLIKARDIDDPEERNAPENLITLCRDCHQRWERLSEAGIRPQIDGVTAD